MGKTIKKTGIDLKMVNGEYTGKESLINPIKYIMNPKKQNLSGAIGADPDNAEAMIKQFEKVKKIYNKNSGRMVKHFIVSASNDINLTPEKMLDYSNQIAQFYGEEYQIVYAVHENGARLHTHFILNTVSYRNGKKYSSEWDELNRLRDYVRDIFKEEVEVNETLSGDE